jgi:hypothetical protein
MSKLAAVEKQINGYANLTVALSPKLMPSQTRPTARPADPLALQHHQEAPSQA